MRSRSSRSPALGDRTLIRGRTARLPRRGRRPPLPRLRGGCSSAPTAVADDQVLELDAGRDAAERYQRRRPLDRRRRQSATCDGAGHRRSRDPRNPCRPRRPDALAPVEGRRFQSRLNPCSSSTSRAASSTSQTPSRSSAVGESARDSGSPPRRPRLQSGRPPTLDGERRRRGARGIGADAAGRASGGGLQGYPAGGGRRQWRCAAVRDGWRWEPYAVDGCDSQAPGPERCVRRAVGPVEPGVEARRSAPRVRAGAVHASAPVGFDA